MRVKEYTLVGFAADPDGLVTTAAPAATGADPNGFAVSQVFDIGASANGIALSQNPDNAASTNVFALAQTYTASVALTLEAAASSISPLRRISFTSAANISSTNFTVVGVGVNGAGAPITGEVVAGPNATTVNSLNAYSSITSITPDQTEGVSTVSVGHPAYLDGTLTLEAGAASLIPPRNITLASGAAADFSNVDFTITGLNPLGVVTSETILGPNNSTVSTTGFFASVTSIALNPVDASVNALMTGGWAANSVPQPLTFDGVLGNGIGVPSDTFAAAKVTLTSGDNLSARTFTVVGLGQFGGPRTEVLTGPNNSTVSSDGLFTRVDTITPDDDAAGSVEAGVAATGFTAFTLLAAAANLNPPREVEIIGSADVSTINFTVIGTDRQGQVITEVITGVTTALVRSKKVYKSVTSITPDATSSDTIQAGWPARTVSPWVITNTINGADNVPQTEVATQILTGAADGVIEMTYENFMNITGEGANVDDSTATAPPDTNPAIGAGVRYVLTSGDSTSLKARFIRPGF